MRIPIATYRVQFNQDFRFGDATAIIPHLHRLGISHLYASPIFAARSGSTHGYDVVDPNRLNPVLGSDADFNAMVEALHSRGMGLLLDIVPNHMAASGENSWWMDVVENGPASPYASYFGINWSSSSDTLQDKIFLPILGDPYGQVLDKGELTIAYDEGGFSLNYYSHRLPVAPISYVGILKPFSEPLLGITEFSLLLESLERLPARTATEWDALEFRYREKDKIKQRLWTLFQDNEQVRSHVERSVARLNAGTPEAIDALDELIQDQAYRIAFWKVATEKINYRRFFDVSDLIGMRVEDPAVFEAGHKLILELVRAGKVDGLRVDHIDGLADPLGYQKKLPTDDVYVVVEKILVGSEELRDDWPVQGTTGYDFLGSVNALFVEPAGLERLTSHYEKLTGSTHSFEDIAYQRKLHVISTLFPGEMQDLGAHLASLAEEDRNARDLSARDITQAITEITACMPVYRTYTDTLSASPIDVQYIDAAVKEARLRNPDINPLVYDYISRVLTLRFKRWMSEASRERWLRFVRNWQQLSGPIMAKGVEDSAMYVYNRLISLNDVGGIPHSISAEELHHFFAKRNARWPHTMNATSTHDTKRSGDVRARIDVLSEIPDEWIRNATRWRRWLADRRRDVHANEEYFLFQTLVGAWPLYDSEVESFRGRMKEYVVKASREARTYTSWLQPNQEHEASLQNYIDVMFDDERFRKSLRHFCDRVAFYGAINSLSQLILKTTAPGVPDFYRGTVSWDFSLVDPDNRRPVDFAPLTDFNWRARDLLDTWQDGRLKVFLTEKLLGFRTGNLDLFTHGGYVPLEINGKRSRNLFAFARRWGDNWCLSVVPRFATELSVATRPPTGLRAWLDTTLVLPGGAPKRWKNIITGESVNTASGSLLMSNTMEHFPMALLTSH
jgi:(1->4)-alpha-D-glucan 1-alpha-D-glucosylmutase